MFKKKKKSRFLGGCDLYELNSELSLIFCDVLGSIWTSCQTASVPFNNVCSAAHF